MQNIHPTFDELCFDVGYFGFLAWKAIKTITQPLLCHSTIFCPLNLFLLQIYNAKHLQHIAGNFLNMVIATQALCTLKYFDSKYRGTTFETEDNFALSANHKNRFPSVLTKNFLMSHHFQPTIFSSL